MFAQKAELEISSLPPVEDGDEEAQNEIMAALHSGVRVNRSASVEGNIMMQGDAEMLSARAQKIRQGIKDVSSPIVCLKMLQTNTNSALNTNLNYRTLV